jgi:hypothetical protein
MAGAAVLASALRALLLGEAPLDAAVMAGVAGFLTVALIVNYVPAPCAIRIDPMEALYRDSGIRELRPPPYESGLSV